MRRLALSAALAGSALLVVGCCSVSSIRTEALPDGTVGEPYRFALEDNCSGSSTTDITAWTLSGQLPPGLRFSDDGRFSGTPTAAGSYSLTIQLMTSSGYVADTVREAKTLVLVIRPAAG